MVHVPRGLARVTRGRLHLGPSLTSRCMGSRVHVCTEPRACQPHVSEAVVFAETA